MFPLSSVNSRGSISFRNGNSYSYEFQDFTVRIAKLSQHVARVWFANHQGMQVPVPPNTFLQDEDGGVHNDFGGSFFITWLGRHTIIHNGVNILSTNNQKQVSVHSSGAHWDVRDAVGIVRRRDGEPVAPLPEPLQPVAIVAVAVDDGAEIQANHAEEEGEEE